MLICCNKSHLLNRLAFDRSKSVEQNLLNLKSLTNKTRICSPAVCWRNLLNKICSPVEQICSTNWICWTNWNLLNKICSTNWICSTNPVCWTENLFDFWICWTKSVQQIGFDRSKFVGGGGDQHLRHHEAGRPAGPGMLEASRIVSEIVLLLGKFGPQNAQKCNGFKTNLP